jgi:mannose-6-phosphate isomerase-like protein (cupin superfamily)
MRSLKTTLLALSLVAALAGPLTAQTAPDATKLFTSASDIQALIAKAKSERKGNDPNVPEPILKLAPYNMNLEYRASVGPASIHEREAEFLYVIEGTGTFVMGGKLVNQTRLNEANLTGTAIEGGTTRSVAKGDYMLVPPGTPHWFKAITSGTLVTMSMHVPYTTP